MPEEQEERFGGFFPAGMDEWSLDLPRRSEHKALLTKWVCLGVVSLPGLLLTNGAQFFGLSVYEAFGWLADATTRRHERKIKRA